MFIDIQIIEQYFLIIYLALGSAAIASMLPDCDMTESLPVATLDIRSPAMVLLAVDCSNKLELLPAAKAFLCNLLRWWDITGDIRAAAPPSRPSAALMASSREAAAAACCCVEADRWIDCMCWVCCIMGWGCCCWTAVVPTADDRLELPGEIGSQGLDTSCWRVVVWQDTPDTCKN